LANAFYPYGKAEMARADFDWESATTVTIYLIDLADYTYSSAHQTLSDVPGGARVASVDLTSRTVSDTGVIDAADPVFTSVTGDVSEALIIALNTGTDSTSTLLLYLDTGVTGLPVTPNGTNINLTFNASGIAQL
jgi:hypothetical protein